MFYWDEEEELFEENGGRVDRSTLKDEETIRKWFEGGIQNFQPNKRLKTGELQKKAYYERGQGVYNFRIFINNITDNSYNSGFVLLKNSLYQ